MEAVNYQAYPLLAEAVLVWTGWGKEAFPQRDDSLLANHFGAEVAAELLPVLRSLEDEFYLSDARHIADDLQEMNKIVGEQFKQKHPEIADEIIRAFAWCYTYDFK